MDTTMNHGMCRCCASEGTFKNLSNAYQWMGQEEIYSDMLKECFDISLTTAEPGEEGGICEVCITQLRNAANFKKQVQHTEVQFKKCLQDKLFKSDLIKVEATNLDDGDDSDNDNNLSDNFSGNEFDMAIKKEKEDPKPKKRVATRASTSRAKKSKVDDGEPSTKRSSSTSNINERPGTVAINVKKASDRNEIKTKNSYTKVNKSVNKTKREELVKHIFNMSQILKYSNATPIRCHDGIHYGCCYCSDLFVSSTDLKRHTIDMHSDLANTRFIKRKSMMDFYLKLDVTNLECVICNTALNTYEELMEHLHSKHEKKLHFDIKNQILPFKFDSEAIRCCICLSTFTKFRALLEHMNSHYRNFVCAICDKGYVNERRLSYHNQIHESGDFSCDFCPKKFNTLQKKKSHEGYHVKPSGRNKCGYCSLTFVCYRQKLKHITDVHGVHHVKLKCLACDRTFYNSRSLNAHTKRYHLMERSRQCTECSKKFFNTSDLTYHMVKHTGIKRFQCDVCLKSYGRKNTLVEHMRIHNNDRKYKCEYCTQTFVQKCNLKGHMRSKHIEFI